MDIAEATQQDIVKDIDGSLVRARRLNMREIGELATRKQQTESGFLHVQIQGLVDAGLKPDQLPAVMRELTKPPTFSEVIRWAFTTEGAMAILELAGVQVTEEINAQEYHFLALECMGIDYERKSEGGGNVPFSQTSEVGAT